MNPRLRRSQSAKKLSAHNNGLAIISEDEPLPNRPVRLEWRPIRCAYIPPTPNATKGTNLQFVVTSHDPHLRPPTPGGALPSHNFSQRQTWPTSETEVKAGSYTFDTVPTLVRTPWEIDRSRRTLLRRLRTADSQHKPLPRRVFESLPREIYDCILDQLETLHSTRSTRNAVALRADTRALLFVDKRWHRVAREHLYRDLWLPSHDDLPKRSLFTKPSSRLKQLLRTLQERGGLASMVRHLHVPAALAAILDRRAIVTDAQVSATAALLASLIETCPNLASLDGYHSAYRDEEGIAILNALASRTGLSTHAWDFSSGGSWVTSSDVLTCHQDWSQLETLVIRSTPAFQLGTGVVSAALQRLPSLRKLMLSRLSKLDFHNGTLLTLPPLRCLRLEELEGVTNEGLEQFAAGRNAVALQRLALIDLKLTSVSTIQALISNLTSLSHLALVQSTSPSWLQSPAIIQDTFRSSSLQSLHWGIPHTSAATDLLVASLASNGMSFLRCLTVPTDNDGTLQALCRPIAKVHLTPSDLTFLTQHGNDSTARSVRLSRLRAQQRLQEGQQRRGMSIVVRDEDAAVMAQDVVGGFLGDVNSRVEYVLQEGVEGSESAVATWSDVTTIGMLKGWERTTTLDALL